MKLLIYVNSIELLAKIYRFEQKLNRNEIKECGTSIFCIQ